MKHIFFCLLITVTAVNLQAQHNRLITGKVYDALSKEPLAGAVISDERSRILTDAKGYFSLETTAPKISIRFEGFESREYKTESASMAIALQPAAKMLQQVVVTANRTAGKRSEAPVAIATISKQTMEDTRANRIDQLLNKISGVFMVSLGNEQHSMSIRQPMTTKSVFLYLEDGIPVRTTGVYNHNALLEMNMAAARNMEVIKGPASALYGAEAIAGAVNIITQASPAYTSGSVSTQWNNNGYRRVDAQAGTSMGKWGVLASGYYANRTNGPVDYSDFHKSAITLRTDYKPGEHTSWSNTLTWIDYYSDMTGALDSTKFAQHNYSTPHTFTFRSVQALRIKSMLSQQWNSNSQTALSLLFRNNSIKQNPSYSVGSTANPLLFRGQINENAFQTYALFAQHTENLGWLNSKLIAGASLDISPQNYYAKFIWIRKDAASGKYTGYTSPSPDSMLSKYKTGISNYAAYLDYEMSPAKGWRIVSALRYDAFSYDFKNSLAPSASSGAPSTINQFGRFTPKIGFTYNYRGTGFYANYSEGYVPPQITELFNSTRVPYLQPQNFSNYEVGGWLSMLQGKIYIDWSLYRMNGSEEIITVKLPDGTTENQNAGKTSHTGIEYTLQYKPNEEWLFRFSGTYAKHLFVSNIVKGVDFSGKDMSGAPKFTGNAEIMYKPRFLPGFRIGLEWQRVAPYYMDDTNRFRYDGFTLWNLRTGYRKGHVEVWINLLNALNTYYATYASKSTAGGPASYAYNMGDPRELTLGISYRFGK